MSDLHLEFESSVGAQWLQSLAPLPDSSKYDMIILAGDIAFAGMRFDAYEQLFFYFEQLNKLNKPILFVPGNHEFYHSHNFDDLNAKLLEKINESKYRNIHILSRKKFVFNNIIFIGATLWTDFNNKDCDEMNSAINLQWNEEKQEHERKGMSEYKVVSTSDGQLITPELVYQEHQADLDYIKQELGATDPEKCVVITHHSPSNKKHKIKWNKRLPSAYSSDLDSLIEDYQPIAWIHGHIHDSLDYHIGGTRIVCNPRGYLGKKINPEFNPNLVVEFW